MCLHYFYEHVNAFVPWLNGKYKVKTSVYWRSHNKWRAIYVTYTVNFWMEKSKLNRSKYKCSSERKKFYEKCIELCASAQSKKQRSTAKPPYSVEFLHLRKLERKTFQTIELFLVIVFTKLKWFNFFLILLHGYLSRQQSVHTDLNGMAWQMIVQMFVARTRAIELVFCIVFICKMLKATFPFLEFTLRSWYFVPSIEFYRLISSWISSFVQI